MKNVMDIEMQNLGLQNFVVNQVDGEEFNDNRESKLYTDPDKSGFVSGTQNLLIRESNPVEMSIKANEEEKQEEEPPVFRPASSGENVMIQIQDNNQPEGPEPDQVSSVKSYKSLTPTPHKAERPGTRPEFKPGL